MKSKKLHYVVALVVALSLMPPLTRATTTATCQHPSPIHEQPSIGNSLVNAKKASKTLLRKQRRQHLPISLQHRRQKISRANPRREQTGRVESTELSRGKSRASAQVAVAQVSHLTEINGDKKLRSSEPSFSTRRKDFPYIAGELGWVSSNTVHALCGGHFVEPKALAQYPNPGNIKKEPTTITSTGPVTYTARGVSILQENVTVTQPGRIVNADQAYIYRDSKGKPSKIMLVGHVRLREQGKLILADSGTLTLSPKTVLLLHTAYHIYDKMPYNATLPGPFDAWGTAQQAQRQANGVIKLTNATYSTCDPVHPAWQITAHRIVLDKKGNKGKAYGAVLKFKHIPILATPYYSFSLNHQRKTGFLAPNWGYNNRTGGDFAFPFYWNMAPNYDLTLTPEVLTRRGYELSSYFRYLSEISQGNIYINYLPNDTEFRRFRTTTFNTFSNVAIYDQAFYAPYLQALRDMQDSRAFFSIDNTTYFNSQWSAELAINYVTDPYYFQDINNSLYGFSTANQLLNRAQLTYSGWHWQFKALAQAYQTLHIINQTQDPALDQYQRLPDFSADAYYPNLTPHLDLYWNSELTNFSYQSDFVPNRPIGQRLHLRPGISFPIYTAGYNITPQLWLDSTSYNVEHVQPNQVRSASRVLPIFDIDSSLYFFRQFHFGTHDYTQTLEPHFFYLFVPHTRQDRLPNFDTVLLPFSFTQLFTLNRFSGVDRLSNANQISFGLTSKILSATTAQPVLVADLGFIYYFVDPKVCLLAKCIPPHEHISPLVADLAYYLTPHWNFSEKLAWNFNQRRLDNTSVSFSYTGTNNRIFSLSYMFVRGNSMSITPDALTTTNTSVFSNDTNQLTFASAWPLFKKWSAIGYFDYNITRRRIDKYYVGVQYDTCCWALRLVTQRSFVGFGADTSGDIRNRFDTAYYFQLQLKGLGDFGTTTGNRLLTSTIPGFTTQ